MNPHLINIIDPNLAKIISYSYMQSGLSPRDFVECWTPVHDDTGSGSLCLLVQVPQVELARAVHCRK